MELSIFLAKLFGLYFLIAGGIIMMRQKSYMHIVMDVLGDKGLLMIFAACQLVAGLALVISHWIWTPDWRGVISLIGAWIMVEAVFYLAAPHTKIVKLAKQFNTPAWYTSGGMLSVVMGAYLAGKGFGFW